MKRRDLTNREIDELGKRLVASTRIGEGEIDDVVSRPNLYDGVLARIAAMDVPEPRARFAWKPVIASAAVVVSVSASLFGYLKFSGAGDPIAHQDRRMPYVLDPPKSSPVESITPPASIKDDEPKPVHAVLTRTVEEAPVPKRRKAKKVVTAEYDPVFHALGFAEKVEDAAIDGRVVRVEMPRAALFALGADVPLENGTAAIKADILVGADGSPRAIRLVE